MNLYHFVRNTIVKDGIIRVHLVVAPTLKRAEELYAGKTQLSADDYANLFESGAVKVEQIYSNVHATIEKVSLLYENYYILHNISK